MKEDILTNTEPFIDKYMAIVATNFNTHIENETVKAIHSVAVNIDEERVKQWIERAKMLDEIDKNNLIDIAIRKKFNQLQEEILELKQQLAENAQYTEQLLEENAQLKKEIDDWKDGTMLLRIEKETRHQVCEEIRDELLNTEFNKAINDIGKTWLLNTLDQIEEGE